MAFGSDAVLKTAEWATRAKAEGAVEFAKEVANLNEDAALVLWVAANILRSKEPRKWAEVIRDLMGRIEYGNERRADEAREVVETGIAVLTVKKRGIRND